MHKTPSLHTQLSPHGLFPFSQDGRAFYDGQLYLGGVIRILSNLSANSDLTIAHNLRAIPRQIYIIYSTGQFMPKWKAVKAWDTINVYIQIDTAVGAAPASITLFIA